MAGKFALRAGFDFHLAYAPERTVEGNAIAEVSRLPQLIGGYTNECARQVANLFSEFVNSVIICENLEAAELGKLVTNSFRDVKFAFANEVAQLATSSNVDVIRMIEDINLGYARNSIPFPSPGVGGPCLTKDSYMLGIANREESVILSARLLNHSMISFTSNKIKNIAESHKGKVLAIGLAFKGVPATNDLRESTPIEICRELIAAGLDVSAIDAVVNQDEILSQGIPFFDNSNSGYSVVCILNNNPSNVKIFLDLLKEWEAKNNLTTLALFDPWGLVTPSDIRKYSIKRFTLSSQVEIE
jgi:nucleotide sugar dehydrogenase